MSEPTKATNITAQPTPRTGKLNMSAAREGLAMVMDGLRVMEEAGAKVSKAMPLFDGRICSLPVIEIPGHTIGVLVMEVMEKDKPKKYRVFTTDGVSVMEGGK